MIGQTLNNRYKITARLGKGAMGTVYRATDTRISQDVAVKIISSDLALDPEILERFKREGEALRKLKHPNIVGYLDAFQHDEHYVIVMDYVSGGSLHELLKSGPLQLDRARQIALDLCDALIWAHRLNIIHRDIKPENILIDEDGTPKLADFGVARLSEGTRMTRTGTQVGTPYYMAPEAWKGETLDGQADIWSLGVVLFEMLSGQVPFDGDTGPAVMTKIFTTSPPDIKKLRADIPQNLVTIVRRMLARDKGRRYQSMRQVAVDLEQRKPSVPGIRLGIGQWRRILIAMIMAGIAYFGILWTAENFQNGVFHPAGNNTEELSFTPTPETTLDIGSTMVSEKDGMAMVLISEGSFVMGSSNELIGNGAIDDAFPTHEVFLSAYWLDRTEVTNEMYALCVTSGACEPPVRESSSSRDQYFQNPEYENYPVIYVKWQDAQTYCTWANRRLPTEAEWEKAARGTSQQVYPWGSQAPQENLLNFGFFTGDTTLVESYPLGSSPYGAMDMAGNVLEWVADWYDVRYYYKSPDNNPPGPESGDYHVLRGGSWNSSAILSFTRFKYESSFASDFIGFRCALTQ